MVRRALFVAVLVLVVIGARVAWGVRDAPGDAGTRYVTIGVDALDAARAASLGVGAGLFVAGSTADVAIVALPERAIGALAEAIHARHDRCGGFVVHDSLTDAEAAVAESAAADAATRPGPGYTLDREAVVRAVLPALDAERIRATIGELSAMQNRYYASASGAAASTWLAERWRSLAARADVSVALIDHGYPQRSVVLTIPGTTRPDEVVVLGGHLDSIARGGVASTAPGADDDASGIATLTEVVRALVAADFRPARTIQVMAYAAEEIGLRGSQQIARVYKERKVNVVGALQLDMTNYQGSAKDIWLMRDFTNAAQNAFLTELIDRYVGATWGMDACGYACSDHASWHRAGVPASMPFEARMRDRNQTIHTGRDTLETSAGNAAHAVKFARLAAAYAIELAKGALGPAAEAPAGTPPLPAIAALATMSAPGSSPTPASLSPRSSCRSTRGLLPASALCLLVLAALARRHGALLVRRSPPVG